MTLASRLARLSLQQSAPPIGVKRSSARCVAPRPSAALAPAKGKALAPFEALAAKACDTWRFFHQRTDHPGLRSRQTFL